MYITCLDVEGVLVPEIWIAFAEASGIPELKKTTRDEPDYNKLMNWRLGILKEHGLGLKEIQETIAKIDPLPGAKAFLDELRTFTQVILISDTFTQFATPLMEKLGYAPQALKRGGIVGILAKAEQAGMAKLAAELGVGEMTLRDIASELEKPGRDPRDELPAPVLRTDVLSMEDLKPGMELTGTVRNVIDFGAFVDIGVHQDGLVHISRMADKFIRHPSEVVHVGDVVTVWVVDVDVKKQRIALSMVKGRT